MERQSTKKNKSDGRDKWNKAHSQGKRDFDKGYWKEEGYYEDATSLREWEQGWEEEADRYAERQSKRRNLRDIFTSDY